MTGTDGKTTSVNMIYAILREAGKKVAMISTVGAVVDGKVYDTGFHITTPSRFEVQKYIRMAVNGGCEYVVLEVSSHSLEQYRVWGIDFYVGVITNITSDHLDYHKTWENYFRAKAKLIAGSKFAVLNRDEKHFFRLKMEENG